MPVISPGCNDFRPWLVFSVACLLACGRKESLPPPDPAVPAGDSARANAEVSRPPSDSIGDTAAATPSSEEVQDPLGFANRPAVKAYPGRPFTYQPVLNRPAAFTLRILKTPDTSMGVEKGKLTWTPSAEGRYSISLEAELADSGGRPGSRIRQDFVVTVEKVLALVLKPLPAQVNKGERVVFDLRSSSYPAWAASRITVRYDYEGDGRWDTGDLPLQDNLSHVHAYTAIGRYAPKVEARFGDAETRTAEGSVSVISSVTPALKISPDTAEPGGRLHVDASGSSGDGRLYFSLDLEGDGKVDWIDSTAGKAVLKAPPSGVYRSVLTVRNAMGQEGKDTAALRVNARPLMEIKARNPKENMAAEVEVKARARDADDSLTRARVNFTGDPKDWMVRTAPPDSQPRPGEWWLRFRHAYGKVGKYTATVCVTSADGRETCRQTAIEIFNAKPLCAPGPDARATVGKPISIEGGGEDPDGKIVKWEWDLDGDGKFDLVSASDGKFQYTFSKEGVFPLLLRVTTADGMTATGTRKVDVRKKWKT